MELKVKFNTIEDIKSFVEKAMRYDSDIDIRSNQYIVDGKSILGIFSLNLEDPLNVMIYGDNAKSFADEIAQFVVE